MLSRRQIINEVENKRIIIDPFLKENLQPNSIDVRLSDILYVITDEVLDFKKRYNYITEKIQNAGYLLLPDKLYLGVTIERTYTPYHIPTYEGRSTTGRYFLQSHQTAGFGDIGFNGHWTLEITVKRPTIVYPGMRIGQIGFDSIEGEIELYNGNYSGNKLPMIGKPGNI